MTEALVGAAAVAVSVVVARSLCDPRSRFYVLDVPNQRSLHTQPTPRSGGLAVLAGLGVSWTIVAAFHGATREIWAIAAAALLVAGISYLDDRAGVAPRVRLPTHLVAAAVLLWGGRLSLSPWAVGLPESIGSAGAAALCLLGVAWMVNLYNFMDGMDGFAAGMAVAGFTALAVLGHRAGATTYALLCLGVASAAAGFLSVNFPPARIFLGDVGSGSLGLLAAGFGLWAVRDGIASAWGIVLIFSPFVVDATVTLGRRVARHELVWRAHRTHYYQRLVGLGWQHRVVVVGEYFLMIGCGATVLLAPDGRGNPPVSALLAWAMLYGLLMLGVHGLEWRRQHLPGDGRNGGRM